MASGLVALALLMLLILTSDAQNVTTSPVNTTTPAATTANPTTTAATTPASTTISASTTTPPITTADQNQASKAYIQAAMQYLPSNGAQQTLGLHMAAFMNTTTSFVGLERVVYDSTLKTLSAYLWVGEYTRLGDAALLAKANSLADGINTLAFQNPLIVPGSAVIKPLPSSANVVPHDGIPTTTLMVLIVLLVLGIIFMCILAGGVIYCLFFRRQAPSTAGTIRRMQPSPFTKLSDREMEMEVIHN